MLRRIRAALFPIERIDADGRRLVLLLWLVAIVQGFTSAQASATVPFTRVALGLSEGDMSLVLALTRVAGVGALAFSRWGDRSGRRRPFLAGFGLLVVAGTATAAVVDAWQFTVLQAGVRLATAAVGTLAVVLLAERIPGHVRAFSISIYGAGGSFGAGLGLIALPLADLGPNGWRIPFLLSAAGLVVIPILVRNVGESPVFESAAPSLAPLTDLLRGGYARWFWLSAGAGLLQAVFGSVALAFSTERLVDDIGFSTTGAVVVSLIGGTTGGIGFFVGGRMADELGRRLTTIVALAATLAGGLVVYWVEQPVWLTLGITISTFGTFAFVPAAASHRAELFPTRFRTTAGTACAYLAMLGSAGGLGIGRFTIDPLGLSTTVTILGSAIVAAAALTALLPETRGQALDSLVPDR